MSSDVKASNVTSGTAKAQPDSRLAAHFSRAPLLLQTAYCPTVGGATRPSCHKPEPASEALSGRSADKSCHTLLSAPSAPHRQSRSLVFGPFHRRYQAGSFARHACTSCSAASHSNRSIPSDSLKTAGLRPSFTACHDRAWYQRSGMPAESRRNSG